MKDPDRLVVSEGLNSVETIQNCHLEYRGTRVSEGLNSVETPSVRWNISMNTTFQKDLIVWKPS